MNTIPQIDGAARLNARSYSNRIFRAAIETTPAGSPSIKLHALEQGAPGSLRQRSALVHELCADLERWIDAYRHSWSLTAEPYEGRIIIEIAKSDEKAPAEKLLKSVLHSYSLA